MMVLKSNSARLENRKFLIDARKVSSYISCLTGLFPCIFSVFNNNILGTNRVIILYLISLIFGVGVVVKERFKLKLEKRLLSFSSALIGILCVAIFNNNYDIERGAYLQVVTYAYMILFAIIMLMDSYGILRRTFFKVFMFYLAIQLIAGFYFLLNPNALLSIGATYFNLGEVASFSFVTAINNGAFMGFVSHYSTAGIYMANGTLLWGATTMTSKSKDGKWNKLAVICFAIFAYALISTQKRAHLLFSVCALIALYFAGYLKGNYQKRFKQLLGALFVAGIVTIVLLQLPAFETVLLRFMFAGSVNEMSTGRIDSQWIPALQLFFKHPFLGIGWRQSIGNLVRTDLDVHNIYIQLICENGIIFGLPIIILMFYAVRKTYKMLKVVKNSNNHEVYGYLMFSFTYQVFFLLYGFTGNPLYDMQCNFPYIVCLAITFGYDSKELG